MVTYVPTTQCERMVRRLAALALWAYFGWYLGVLVGNAAGLPSLAGPVAAMLMAVVALIEWPRLGNARRERTVEGTHARG